MKTITTLALLVCLNFSNAYCQTASIAAEAYFESFFGGDYVGAAEMYSPKALKEIREMLDFGSVLSDDESEMRQGFYDGMGLNPDSVATMTDAEFFAGMLGSIMGMSVAGEGMKVEGFEILGEVPEGDVVHVLTRSAISMGELQMESMEVMSFTLEDGEWKGLLSSKMTGMIDMIKNAMQMEIESDY